MKLRQRMGWQDGDESWISFLTDLVAILCFVNFLIRFSWKQRPRGSCSRSSDLPYVSRWCGGEGSRMGWKFARVRSGRDARGCPTVTYGSIVKSLFTSGRFMLEFIWLQSNRCSCLSMDLFISYLPNFPLHIFHPMPHATVGIPKMYLCAALYRYTVILANWSLLGLSKLEFHLLHVVPTIVICGWPKRAGGSMLSGTNKKKRPRSTQSMRSTTGALWALGFGLFMALGIAIADIENQLFSKRATVATWKHSIASPIFAFWFQKYVFLLLSLEYIAVDDVTFLFLLFGWGRLHVIDTYGVCTWSHQQVHLVALNNSSASSVNA